MRDLKVSKKLLFSFGTVLVLLALIVGVSIASLESVSGELDHFYSKPYQLVKAIDDMNSLLQEGAKNMLHACVDTDAKATRERLDMASDIVAAMEEKLEYLKKNYGGDKREIEGVERGVQAIEAGFAIFEPLCMENNITEAFRVYQEQILPQLASIGDSVDSMKAFEDEVALSAFQGGRRMGKYASLLMVVIGIVSVIAGVGLALYITRLLVNCIAQLREAAVRMSEGDFDAPLTYHSKDELGELSHGMRVMTENIKAVIEDMNDILGEMAEGNFSVKTRAGERYVGVFNELKVSLEKMNGSLSDVLSRINQSADQVASGSEQVSSGAQALSQGATEQASSVEELAATINEISSRVRETAENAARARAQASSAGEAVVSCNEQMQEMIRAMDEIAEKSSEISKIIKTIEDIAFQTNILALNAAVEAARAGAAGKGFAVVADEVRNLASKSAEASKNTSALIEGSVKAVQKGTDIANGTALALSDVVEGSKSTAGIVGEIAEAADGQAASIAQITLGIDQISSVVQTNSATAEESAAASEELSGQAQLLKELVGRFKLDV